MKRSIPDWRAALLLGLVLIAFYIVIPNVHRVVFGLGLVPLALLLAEWERQRELRFHKAIALMGSASYAIYLVHNPVISLTARLLDILDSWALMFAALVLAGIAAGLAYHLAFEKQALRLASRGWGSTRFSRHRVA